MSDESGVMTRPRLDNEVRHIEEQIIAMGTATEKMLREAIHALTTNDIAKVQDILKQDDAVDELDEEVEREALLMLALQQPVFAYDLRFVGTVLKVITDLERIGDHAVNIAKTTERMARGNVAYAPLIDLPRYGEWACGMIRQVTEAFANRDLKLADSVIAQDDDLDVFYMESQRELRTALSERPFVALCASHLLFVTHDIERIGDHATNIAERLYFLETGKRREPKR